MDRKLILIFHFTHILFHGLWYTHQHINQIFTPFYHSWLIHAANGMEYDAVDSLLYEKNSTSVVKNKILLSQIG